MTLELHTPDGNELTGSPVEATGTTTDTAIAVEGRLEGPNFTVWNPTTRQWQGDDLCFYGSHAVTSFDYWHSKIDTTRMFGAWTPEHINYSIEWNGIIESYSTHNNFQSFLTIGRTYETAADAENSMGMLPSFGTRGVDVGQGVVRRLECHIVYRNANGDDEMTSIHSEAVHAANAINPDDQVTRFRMNFDNRGAVTFDECVYFERYFEGEWHHVPNEIRLKRVSLAGGSETVESIDDFIDIAEWMQPAPQQYVESGRYAAHWSTGRTTKLAMIDGNGIPLVDIDVTRDATSFTTLTDGAQNKWQAQTAPSHPGTFGIVPNYIDHWSPAYGLSNWRWQGPHIGHDDTPGEYVLRFRQAGTDWRPTYVNVTESAPFRILAPDQKPEADRYTRRGTSTILWVEHIADPNNPTREELRDGTILDCAIADITGLTTNHTPQQIPVATSPYERALPGTAPAPTPTISLYDNLEDTSKIRPLFDTGSKGFLAICPHGTDTGQRIQIVPAMSAGNRDVWTLANEAARIEVQLTATAAPANTRIA